ncbi:hypothetical protein [[Clostridium] colinum]|uniref:hypothetical protein n=1 Tax=[Clostridium] colinum TaxID=36835 RepID=UPI00202495C0|nr:hypothetical protein [[Clostridium] colinum]
MSLYNYSNRGYCGCDCDCNQVCAPDKIDNSCSLNSIRKTLLEIINAVKNENLLGFNIDVEITTNDGITNTINFSKLTINSIELTKTTLIAQGIAISLCDIAKITILTSTTTSSAFNSSLLNSIKNITTTCSVPDKYSYNNCDSCNSNTDIQCAQGIQNYINQNIGAIDAISYNGNSTQSQTVELITGITTGNALQSSTLNTTNVDVLNSATLENTNIPVVNSITLNDVDVVSQVETENNTLLTGLTPNTVEVSAPITATPVTVVSNIDTNDDTNVVTNVTNTTKNVINQVSSTTGTVVTGFTGGSSITGVISNVDILRNIIPTSLSIPAISSTGTGTLTVTIPAKSIDGNNPTNDIVLNVTAGNQNISFNGNTTKYVLNDNTNLLGGSTENATTTTVNQIGTPTTDTFIKTVSSTNIPVIDTVTSSTVPTKLINSITTTPINNIATPTTANVIETLTTTTKDVQTITNITSVKPTDLLSSTTENVLNSSTLTTTTDNAINTVTLQNTPTTVITNITTSPQNIPIPIKENIDGKVFTAGDGIMGVNNTNGDITVYSICDINTVNTNN